MEPLKYQIIRISPSRFPKNHNGWISLDTYNRADKIPNRLLCSYVREKNLRVCDAMLIYFVGGKFNLPARYAPKRNAVLLKAGTRLNVAHGEGKKVPASSQNRRTKIGLHSPREYINKSYWNMCPTRRPRGAFHEITEVAHKSGEILRHFLGTTYRVRLYMMDP